MMKSTFAILGLLLILQPVLPREIHADSLPIRGELRSSYLVPRKSFKLAPGDLIDLKLDQASGQSPRCQLINRSQKLAHFRAGHALDVVSLAGSPGVDGMRHDWDFTLPQKALVSLHCDFPQGVTETTLQPALSLALRKDFGLRTSMAGVRGKSRARAHS